MLSWFVPRFLWRFCSSAETPEYPAPRRIKASNNRSHRLKFAHCGPRAKFSRGLKDEVVVLHGEIRIATEEQKERRSIANHPPEGLYWCPTTNAHASLASTPHSSYQLEVLINTCEFLLDLFELLLPIRARLLFQ